MTDTVIMMLKFSVLGNHPESYDSQKCPKSLLHQSDLSCRGPSATKKLKPLPAVTFPIVRAEGNIRKKLAKESELTPL